MSLFCNHQAPYSLFIVLDVHNVTNVSGTVSLRFMFLGKEVLISSKVASDHDSEGK